MKSILVLGGGIGWIVAARTLRRKLPKRYKVTLVDRTREFAFAPSFLWLMLGWRKPRQIMRDLARLQKHGITYVQAEVSRIDAANRAVTINGDARPYDRLVLAMGADVAPEAIPGLSVASHHPY